MKIFLSYGYRPYTTAVYFEKVFLGEHEVVYVGPPFAERPGYLPNEDVSDLAEEIGCPDLFFFIEPGINFFPRGLERIACPTACYLIDVHCDLRVRELYAPFFDYIFVAQKDYVQHFKDIGHKNVYWLPLGCDPEIHGEEPTERIYDIGFVGKTMGANHPRGRLLHRISERYTTNDFNKFYPKEDITAIYSRSKIVVNIPVNGDLNMRVFEAMASGALLITETISNGQREFFQEGVHIVEYKNETDLFGRIDYYLKNEKEREGIARAGQQLVLGEHTYKQRSKFVIDTVLKDTPADYTAKIRTMSARDIHYHYARVYTLLRLVDPVIAEIRNAYKTHNLSIKLWLELAKSLLRSVNEFIPLTPRARKARKDGH